MAASRTDFLKKSSTYSSILAELQLTSDKAQEENKEENQASDCTMFPVFAKLS